MKVEIDGIKYIPQAEVTDPGSDAVKVAIRTLVAWTYLRDKPGNAIWAALEALSPDLHALAGQDAAAAFERVETWPAFVSKEGK